MNPKRSGIIRRFDMLGRIVVPKEIRQALRLKEGDAVIAEDCVDAATQGQVSPAPIPTRAISRTIFIKKGCSKCPVSLDMGQGIRMPSLSRRRLPGARRKKYKKISDKYSEPP